jgi:uncharacterized spore protein YtfJ
MGGNGNVTTTDEFKDIMEHVGKGTNASTIYGETQVIEGRAIIPVAEIHYMGGGGLGGGRGPASEEGSANAVEGDAYGEGMGLGFNVTARPLGAIEVTSEGVAWAPVIDVNRIATIWSVVTGAVVIMAAIKFIFGGRS